ncbi:heme NO-binding domain-containing protein [Magnetococcus sp. PR-3]|uniref:heme NO-binding domain-containing protein n=1 Tax=Magnetococcus sp. PR-3 TaxID=3120355 RepID=UPI002FCE40D1
MHGFMFVKWRSFVASLDPPVSWSTIIDEAELVDEPFHPSLAYPDLLFSTLIRTTARQAGLEPQQLLEDFGRSLAIDLIHIAGLLGLIQTEWRTLDVVENVKNIIHAGIHSYNPQVSPPEIRTIRTKNNEVALGYQSSRRLLPMLKGIVHGIADYYDEEVVLTETHPLEKERELSRINVVLVGAEQEMLVSCGREIKEILKRGGDIKLYNIYKGVPISYPGYLQKVHDNAVMVKASKTQLIAMQAEGMAFFSSPHVDMGLQGRVSRIDWNAQTAILDHIQYAEGAVGLRLSIRVEPSEEIPVKLRLGDRVIPGVMMDLSMGGCNLLTEKVDEVGVDDMCELLELHFELNVKNWDPFLGEMESRKVSMKPGGELLGVYELSRGSNVRVSFTEVSNRDMVTLEQYIMQIQLDVLRELRDRIQ